MGSDALSRTLSLACGSGGLFLADAISQEGELAAQDKHPQGTNCPTLRLARDSEEQTNQAYSAFSDVHDVFAVMPLLFVMGNGTYQSAHRHPNKQPW